MKKKQPDIRRIQTGVKNLDSVLGGGIPRNSLVVFAGSPGAGKTILSQQIGFHNASSDFPVIFFQTLSEPTPKTIAHANRFSYYDQDKIGKSVHFIDLGDLSTLEGLNIALEHIMENVKRIQPALVCIDSFRAFEDLSNSREELRKFSYRVAVNLMAWECTCLLLGEFNLHDMETNPLFSVMDGIILMNQLEESGEQQRFIQVTKMRSTQHSRDRHSLTISEDGVDVYAPNVTIKRDPKADKPANGTGRCKTGIQALDLQIEEGIPRGSTLLISGASGTGKTMLSLEFIFRGAREFNERGILFLFEETEERILAVGSRMGWDIESEIKRGMIQIVTIPQTEILVEKHLLMIHERITSFGASRVTIDSSSVFLHKIERPQIAREKIYQLATIIQGAHAVGFLVTDVPFGTKKISRFGVEETVVDGVILLTTRESGLVRGRYLEIYKIRNTVHSNEKHSFMISKGGIVMRKNPS